MTLNELLLEWSYRSEKGYPNLDSPSDISLLKKILIELDLPANKIISNIEEAKTTSTEDLHEIFVAIFVAGHEKLSKDEFSSAKWIKSLQNLNKLIDPTKHISAIEEYKESLTNDKIYDLYTDAEKISNKLNSSLGYPEGLKGVSRVFATGKKEKGDIYVNQDVPGFKDRVEISLKYGKGQFNSLSASELIGTFYDIPEEVLQRKGTGFLTQIYKKDNKYKNAIDKGVREYLKFVINNYEQIQPDYQNKLKEGEKEILDNFDKNLLNNIEWEEWRKIGNNGELLEKKWHEIVNKKYSKIKDILSSIFASAAVRACLLMIFANPLLVSRKVKIRVTISPGISSDD